MTKKTLIIVLSIVAAVAIAVGIILAVILTRKPDKPPSAGDSTIYQTKSEEVVQLKNKQKWGKISQKTSYFRYFSNLTPKYTPKFLTPFGSPKMSFFNNV